MQIEESNDGEILVMSVTGRIDSATAKGLEDVLSQRMQDVSRVILDLTGVQYVSSAGLRVILKAAKIATAAGHRLVLSSLAPGVLEVFQISGFTRIFDIQFDRAAAVRILS